MIIVRKYITADNADVLSGTDLASIPNNGVLTIYTASDQQDSLVTITGSDVVPPYNSTPIEQRTSSQINVNEMIPARLAVRQGGQITINVDVVTAGTVQILAVLTRR